MSKYKSTTSYVRHGRAKGGKPDSILVIWRRMKNRCLNPSDQAYERYGGRGITICDSWLDFTKFLIDMGERPIGKTLDRIDNNLGYSLNNCRWASYTEQNNNRRDNRMLNFKGETKTMAQWCQELNLSKKAVSQRLNAYGWAVERALTEPIRKKSTS